MTPTPSTPTRGGIGSIAAALIMALGPLLWLCYAVQRASYAGLGRDQGIFQGTAWALRHGARLYRDLREINGPLVHEIHSVASLFGGFDPHVLRCFDLGVSAFVFASFGAALPGAILTRPTIPSRLERTVWAAAACVVLLAQYVSFYNFWHLTQRESFFNWFVLGGFASALCARTAKTASGARAWLFVTGIASATLWFGKPQCVAYTLLHIATFAWGPPAIAPLTPRRRFLPFAAGLGLGCAIQLIFLLSYCGIPEFIRIYLLENPRYYFNIGPRFLSEIVTLEGHIQFYPLALALSLGVLGLVALQRVGRHLIGLAAFPVVGIAFDVLQGKAFTYHLHPVTAGAAALALTVTYASTADNAGAKDVRWVAWMPMLLASLVAYYSAQFLIASPHLRSSWAATEGESFKDRRSARYLSHYDTHSFSSTGLVAAGAFLKQHTRPSDQIQMYGMDPYLLALAERQSATPYIYFIDLNPDAALEGIRARGGGERALETARALAHHHVTDFVARVRRSGPAAFVTFDHAPFKHPTSGFEELVAHVPELLPILRTRYRAAGSFGLLHVYLRNDR